MKRGERDKLGRVFNIKSKRCAVCEQEFEPRNGTQRYCSPECQRETELEHGECEWCGRAFTKRKQSKPARFCGVKCSSQATAKQRSQTLTAPRQLAMCAQCGNPILSKRATRYCSRPCAAKAQRKGKKRRWVNGEWGLKKKGEEFCRNCGALPSHLHHIVPRSKTTLGRDDIENNGLPLCFECHRGWHDRRVTIYRDRLHPHELENAIKLTSELWVENNYPYTPDQELRRRAAIGYGDSPDNEWRYCLEGRNGDRAVYDAAIGEVMDTLHEAEARGVQL